MSINLGTQLLEASTQRNQNEAVDLEGVITPKPLADGRGCVDVKALSDPVGFGSDIEKVQESQPGDNLGVR